MDKIIIKYLSGTATNQEKTTLESWLHAKPDNIEFFVNLKHSFALYTAPQKQISNKETSEFMDRLAQREGEKERANVNYFKFKKIAVVASAAAVIIFASFLFLRMQNSLNSYKNDIAYMLEQSSPSYQYSTPYGVKGKVVLPDSSVVWLNSGSKISFPAMFNSSSRDVTFSGEGYFEVKKNEQTPMNILLQSGLTVKVLGTKFNLSSYENDKDISLLLLSGKVNINNSKGKVLYAVKPSEKVKIDLSSNSATVNNPAETLPTIGWKAGWLIFEDTPLDEVFKKIERWYGQKIVVKDKSIFSKTLTAKFKEESVSQVFELMEQISLINYYIEDSVAYISN